MSQQVQVGIDVSADSFSVAYEIPGQALYETHMDNSAAGHRKLCRLLTRGGRPARVCLEATGIYSLDLALALHRTPGIEVMVVNPRVTKDFMRARMHRTKTDATDAVAILEFVQRMPFTPWQPPAPEILALRAITRRITALTLIGGQERNRRHAAARCREFPGVLEAESTAHLEFLKTSIQRLTQEALAIIQGHPRLRRWAAHLVSVTGIATTSAIRLLAELAVLPDELAARQWVAHAGLDPRHFESGTSVKKPTRISKTGNRYLRAALYMPALVAIQHEPHVKAFYEQLLARAKKPMQAIVAVMRTLLHAIYGMFRHGRDFEGDKFYALTT
jgi:transposase